ncbi:ABC transporter substrate-binding protein [Variovorax sp. dw_954]|nr:ABC transporter substrate-binding protein [Variovorax sp. dw_954]
MTAQGALVFTCWTKRAITRRRVDRLEGGIVVNRRNVLVGMSLGWPASSWVHAQRAPRTLGTLSPYTSAQSKPYGDVLFEAMQDLGYTRGRDYVLVDRYADGKVERLPGLAEELVALKVDLIETSTTNGALAAQRATSVIPIVFESVSDPVRSGFADSLSHPGHNMTGLSNSTADLTGKRIQLFKQMVPGLKRLGVLSNPANPNYPSVHSTMQPVAEQLDLRLLFATASTPDELPGAFLALAQQQADAVSVSPDAFLWSAGKQIAALALAHRMPSMFGLPENVRDGGLMSYGIDSFNTFRQLAKYVDKVFKGARPADMPIEQPSKFDLIINRKTAGALGLKIPQELVLQAEKLIDS